MLFDLMSQVDKRVERERLWVEQGECCPICGEGNTGRRLYLDHDHRTGRVRGALHGKCNAEWVRLADNEPGYLATLPMKYRSMADTAERALAYVKERAA